MSAQIVVVSGPDQGRTFTLSAGTPLQVGRSTSTNTQLSDASVSRLHCEVQYDGGGGAVLINHSANGTLVNGKPASRHELRHGDLIRVGGTELRYQVPAMEDSETLLQPAPAAPPRPAPAAASLSSLAGGSLGAYAVESVIAKGPSSWVFKAVDTRDNTVVALKVLEPEFSRSEEEMQRFVRAMKTVLPLKHDHIVPLYAAGRTGAFCWMAMEHVEGESMTQVIQRIGVAGMLDWRYGYRVAVHIARALDYAHGQSIIHRNVTPANILLRSSDKVAMLGDLMLARALEGALAQQVTRPGALLGDITYMSPERTRGTTDVDVRSDIYGLGATVYALIAGRPPFSGGALPEMIAKIRTAEPELPKKFQMSIPELFQGTVMKMMAKAPEQRFQTAREVLTDLERVGRFAGVTA